LMLGRVDESHIIRCIEYWDIERKRLPNYDHCAVLVAEEVTTRFLNVISHFNGAIPMMALQLNAIQVHELIVLHFTRVLDEVSVTTTSEEQEELAEREATDRNYWQQIGSELSLRIVDECLEILKEFDSSLALTYNKYYIGLRRGNRPNNFAIFKAKKKFLRVEVYITDLEGTREELKNSDIDVIGINKRWGAVRFMINEGEVRAHRETLKKIFLQAQKESME